MDFKHFSISDVGRVRQANEDNCGDRMTVNGYVFVVCDGMGGHVGGATASTMAVECLLNYFENPIQNMIVGIHDAFKIANEVVFNAAIENPELKGMGTTGTILIINNDACYLGHVGDSRIYLKSDGKLNRLTKDHSFVQNLVDQGIISDDDAEAHPKKNQILAAIGIKPNVNSSVCEAPIHPKPGDCFLLCSDGLNGMIRDREIEDLISADDLEISCRKLIDAANNAGGNDNVTATLVAITESPYTVSIFKHFNPVPFAATTIIEQRNVPIYGKTSKRNLLPWIMGGVGAVAAVFLIWFFFFKADSSAPKVTHQNKPKKEESEKNSKQKNDRAKNNSEGTNSELESGDQAGQEKTTPKTKVVTKKNQETNKAQPKTTTNGDGGNLKEVEKDKDTTKPESGGGQTN